ncbi:esterase FE4-like [Maniola hyperantus]|uniref:esterase FE4-like n=1 Tax=Aphantopus hyperantus TaxID=2795564 RepID=UPI00156A295F|nr:esterase FE4-like [Maniola hyperantus]XP_034838914.1 esterase FE4-like [Maniola hyperantus]
MWATLCLVLLVGISEGRERLDPLVQTNQGLIRGQRGEDGDYYMFLGIPYGQVDENNPFGVSTPHLKFDDIYEANDDFSVCPQIRHYTNDVIGTLDCLHLNIYVPAKASSRNRLAVLVYIHGSSFDTGYASRTYYGPKHLVKHDVVVVQINYRLGPYGFLCLGTEEVPGNQGIKDQLLALRWIKDNIASFGGDGNKITLMGESAGAASVELHLLSKQEKLYNKAILQSGTMIKPNGIHDADVTPALQIADKLGFTTDDVTEALNFIKQADPKLLIGAYSELSLNLRACVEKQIENTESIITEHPVNLDIPKIRGMPILVGYNNREALLIDHNKPNDYFKDSNYFKDTIAQTFNIDEDLEEDIEIVRNFYIGDEELTEDVRSDIIDFESDFYYNYPIQGSIGKYLENRAGNVYQYLFSYEGGRNYIKNKFNISLEGAAHGDELGYLFDMSVDQGTPSDGDQLMFDRMTTLWTNFVKYGDPTPETTELLQQRWLPVTNTTVNYLSIDSELVMKKRPFKDRLAFWKLFFKTNRGRLRGLNEN